MPGDEERIREGGCVDYLAKPFSSTALIETVRRCLAR
jgi:two-component system cell cycle response regulator DivK